MEKKRTLKQKRKSEENSIKSEQKNITNSPKISQLAHKNRIQNTSETEPNPTTTVNEKDTETNTKPNQNEKKENLPFSQKRLNKKFFILPSHIKNKLKHRKINSNITQITKDLKLDELNKKKISIFSGIDPIKEIRNNSVENSHNQIYVHKKLKGFNHKINNKILKTDNNEKNSQNTLQNNKKKDYFFTKLKVFPNKTKYFRKKNLSGIGKINNDSNGKIKNIKYFNRSPFIKKKQSFFKVSNEENNSNDEDDDDDNINKNEEDVNYDLPDDIEHRLDNINDYINIYSINDKSLEKIENNDNIYEDNDNNNISLEEEEEDKIIINKNSNKKNKKIFINTNKLNNNIKNNEEKNTININKNIIINKKIILIPEEQSPNKTTCSKTSYGFFNTYRNTYKNIINIPYSNVTNHILNPNTSRNNVLSHCKTKQALTNFVYQKKNFASPTPKMKKYISYCRKNSTNDKTKSIIDLINTQPLEEYQMSNTITQFYEPKKKNNYKNIGDLTNQTFDKNNKEKKNMSNLIIHNLKFRLSNGRIKNDIYYKLNSSRTKIKNDLNNSNNNILIIDEKNDTLNQNKNEDNSQNNTNDLSLLEISKFLEKKLKLIVNKISKYQNTEKECYEFIHFYFDNNYNQLKIENFKNNKNKELMINYTKMEIIYLFLCYNILCSKKFNKSCIILKSIFSLLYDNLILFLILIIKNYKNNDKEIVSNINAIINEYKEKNKCIKNVNMNENKIVEIIGNNSNDIIIYYKMLIDSLYKKFYNEKDHSVKFPECIKNIDKEKNDLNKKKNIIYSFFNETYKNIKNYNFLELKYFFYLFLSNKNEKISIKQRLLKHRKSKTNKNKEKEDDNISIKSNYILPPIKNNYKYTLILGLDETLIYNNIDNYASFKKNKPILLRPNIHEFLHEMKQLFELVIFSEKSKDYVDPIIDKIQQKEKYFSYVLDGQYVILDNNGQEVKNINLLGRSIKNVVIIDNTDHYYKSFKENLICIQPFYGDNKDDKNIFKIFENVLKEIKIDSDKTGDIRISLNKFRYKLYPKDINNIV